MKFVYKRNGNVVEKSFENPEDLMMYVVMHDVKDEEFISMEFNGMNIEGGVDGIKDAIFKIAMDMHDARIVSEIEDAAMHECEPYEDSYGECEDEEEDEEEDEDLEEDPVKSRLIEDVFDMQDNIRELTDLEGVNFFEECAEDVIYGYKGFDKEYDVNAFSPDELISYYNYLHDEYERLCARFAKDVVVGGGK